MSDDAAAAPADAPPKKSKKKLIIIVVAALVLAGGGGGGFFYMKQKAAAAAAAAAAAEEDEEAPVAKAAAHKDPKAKPTYVPLEPFVVNLADRESEKYAQIGITLQVDDAKVADDMKTYMPALRNGILMILAHKSSEELLQRDGKETLAQEIMIAAAQALGIEIEDAEEAPPTKSAKKSAHAADDEEEEQPKKSKKKKKKKKKAEPNPVTHVHFSNFIIQ
jgi:flagellar FliL protein